MPYLQAQVEDGQGDGWQEDGGSALAEVERDGTVQLSAAAAARLRHLQELRGPLASCVHGRQRRGHAWQSHLLRAQGGCWCRRQEEVRSRSSKREGAVVRGCIEAHSALMLLDGPSGPRKQIKK